MLVHRAVFRNSFGELILVVESEDFRMVYECVVRNFRNAARLLLNGDTGYAHGEWAAVNCPSSWSYETDTGPHN